MLRFRALTACQLLCTCLVLIGPQLTRGNHIHITATVNQACQPCTSRKTVSGICCLTINELPDYQLPSKGTLKVTFEPGQHNFNLSGSIRFQNLKRLEIGKWIFNSSRTLNSADTVVLKCEKKGIGIKFFKISSIQCTDISISNCGARFKSKPFKQGNFISSALFLDKCVDVQLIGVSVNHSLGVGVTMYDVTGNTNLIDCTFHNNGGGGLYIEFTPSHHTAGTRYFEAYITILQCTFTQNHAISSRASTQQALNSATLNQGGGISINFRAESYMKHFINITECDISNNTAEWGGGLHLLHANDGG